jgi:hypothetical protein
MGTLCGERLSSQYSTVLVVLYKWPMEAPPTTVDSYWTLLGLPNTTNLPTSPLSILKAKTHYIIRHWATLPRPKGSTILGAVGTHATID